MAKDRGTLEPILSTRGLTIWFGGLAAINGVNFSLYEGEVKALDWPERGGEDDLL